MSGNRETNKPENATAAWRDALGLWLIWLGVVGVAVAVIGIVASAR